MAYKLSPSSLGLMKECPRCFWLQHHKIWKRPQAKFPSLPSGFDKALKEHFDSFIETNQLPPVLRNIEELENIKLFKDREKLKVWRNNFKGIRFKDENSNEIFGAIDTILEKDGKLIVLDYKTRGYPIKEDTVKYYKDQLDIYNYLLRKNGFETENFSILIFYIPKKTENPEQNTSGVEIETTIKFLEVDIENAEKIWKSAIQLLEGPCPEERCEWCQRVELNE